MKKRLALYVLLTAFAGSAFASLSMSDQYYINQEKLALQEVYGHSLCNNPEYKCIRVKPGQTWYDLFPYDHQREIVMRLNRTNVALQYRTWLVVPKHLKKVSYMSLSPFPQHIDPPGERLVMVDLAKFAFAAYEPNGDLRYWGPATGGQIWCSDLNRTCESAQGTYRIYRIQGADCQSSKYPIDQNGGAPMPYCMHYFEGYALHASTLSGFYNHSKGCVRLFDDDAKWLNEHFMHYGTKVIVSL